MALISKTDDFESTILGRIFSGRRLAASPEDLARLMSDFETATETQAETLAAVLQGAALKDRHLRKTLEALASAAIAAGCLGPGGALEGLQVSADLDNLLNGQPFSVDDHSSPSHLLRLAGLIRQQTPEPHIDSVIRLLQLEASKEPFHEVHGEALDGQRPPETADKIDHGLRMGVWRLP